MENPLGLSWCTILAVPFVTTSYKGKTPYIGLLKVVSYRPTMRGKAPIIVEVEETEVQGRALSIERALEEGEAVWLPTNEGYLTEYVA